MNDESSFYHGSTFEDLGLAYDKQTNINRENELNYSDYGSFEESKKIQLPLPSEQLRLNSNSKPYKSTLNLNLTADNPIDAAVVFSVQTFKCTTSRTLLVYNVPLQLATEDLLSLFSSYGDVETIYCGRKSDLHLIVISYSVLSHAEKALETLSSNTFPVEVQYCVNVVLPKQNTYNGDEIEDIFNKKQNIYYNERKLLFLNSNEVELKLNCGNIGRIISIKQSNEQNGLIVEFDSIKDCKVMLEKSRSWSQSLIERVIVIPIPLEKNKLRLGNSLYAFVKGSNRISGTESVKINESNTDFKKLDVNASTFLPKPNQHSTSRDSFGRSSRQVAPTGSHPHHQSKRNGNHQTNRNNNEFLISVDKILKHLDKRTSVMIRNIPNKYTQQNFIEELNVELKGEYDFFYLPIDFKNKCNVGYAFLNVTDYKNVVKVFKTFNGRNWTKYNSDKVCVVSYAKLQGKVGLINRFKNSSLMKKEKDCRPLIFVSNGPFKGTPEEFPV